MSQVIRIPPEIFSRLEKLAKGFDTPISVIERLLDHSENCDNVPTIKASKEQSHSGMQKPSAIERPFNRRDTTKYTFNNYTYGKGRLVLAVVQDYVASHPGTPFDELRTVFPKYLQGSSGVFCELAKAQDIYTRTGHKRHYLNPNEVVKLSDATIAVCTQWGAGNIDGFVKEARSLGYEIEEC